MPVAIDQPSPLGLGFSFPLVCNELHTEQTCPTRSQPPSSHAHSRRQDKSPTARALLPWSAPPPALICVLLLQETELMLITCSLSQNHFPQPRPFLRPVSFAPSPALRQYSQRVLNNPTKFSSTTSSAHRPCTFSRFLLGQLLLDAFLFCSFLCLGLLQLGIKRLPSSSPTSVRLTHTPHASRASSRGSPSGAV